MGGSRDSTNSNISARSRFSSLSLVIEDTDDKQSIIPTKYLNVVGANSPNKTNTKNHEGHSAIEIKDGWYIKTVETQRAQAMEAFGHSLAKTLFSDSLLMHKNTKYPEFMKIGINQFRIQEIKNAVSLQALLDPNSEFSKQHPAFKLPKKITNLAEAVLFGGGIYTGNSDNHSRNILIIDPLSEKPFALPIDFALFCSGIPEKIQGEYSAKEISDMLIDTDQARHNLVKEMMDVSNIEAFMFECRELAKKTPSYDKSQVEGLLYKSLTPVQPLITGNNVDKYASSYNMDDIYKKCQGYVNAERWDFTKDMPQDIPQMPGWMRSSVPQRSPSHVAGVVERRNQNYALSAG